MTEYLTEQEQVEILKRWIKQYTPVFLLGIALALITITAWNFWQNRQHKIAIHAANLYQEMIAASDKPDQMSLFAKKIKDQYSQTAYAPLASLLLAKIYTDKNDNANAQAELNWVIANSNSVQIKQLAKIRLAKFLLANNDFDKALQTLNTIDDKTFTGLIWEVKGDIYLAMNNSAKAKEAYKNALQAFPNAPTMRPILQIKYYNLSTTTDTH